MDAMKYNDLRDFLTLLEQQGELKLSLIHI